MTQIFDDIQKTIERYDMISSEDSLITGVSGGPDSVALLLLLIEQYPKMRIGVLHLNHCLRGRESDRDEEFVINIAKKYLLPCYTLKIDVLNFAKINKLSFEEAARELRYSFYMDIAQKERYTKIALGHNSDDNAELILMNLLRGSGTKGISGIPPIRDNHVICNGIGINIKIIRPLIEVSREDIIKYLDSKQQQYMVDSSNSDMNYLRNKIRHSLIPHLKEEYNPSITDSLNRLSRIMLDENSFMENRTEEIFNSAVINNKSLNSKKHIVRDNINSEFDKNLAALKKIVLDTTVLLDIHQALVKRVIRRAVKEVKGDLRRITLNHIEDIIKLIYSKSSGKIVHLPDRIRIIKSKHSICFRKEPKPLRVLNSFERL